MKQVSVLLDSVEKIRSFVDIIEKSEADADLSQGSRHVDAKSLIILHMTNWKGQYVFKNS